MGETLSGKRCFNCKYYQSYYQEYNYDTLEPKWCGRCLNELISKERDYDDYVEENDVCHLWTPPRQQNEKGV